MRGFVLSIAILSATIAAVDVTPTAAQVGARIWVDNEPEYFRRGDRMNVSFSVSDDSYVAVVHVDTEGNLDFVFPASPWDNEFVRGGGVFNVSARGTSGAWTVRGRPGIGYFYLIASPDPLDFSYFRGGRGSPWEWGYAGRAVRGDPFLALDQIARLLLPPSPYPRYVYDFYSYYVDGIHQYPSYACSNQYYDYGWGMYPSYGSCSQQDYFLRTNPYYYDTRRYRGDRRQYLRQYETLDPRHGFKESPDRPARGITPRDAPGFSGSSGQIPRREPVAADPTPSTQTQGRAPAQGRPATQTRPAAQPAPRAEPRSAQPSGARGRPAPTTDTRREPTSSGTPQAAPSSGRAPARGRPAP